LAALARCPKVERWAEKQAEKEEKKRQKQLEKEAALQERHAQTASLAQCVTHLCMVYKC
jgi:hypothetical protein